MTEYPVATRKEIADALLRAGHAPGRVSEALPLIEDGAFDRALAVLHPEVARAFWTRSFLDRLASADRKEINP